MLAGVRSGDEQAARHLVETLYPTVIRIVRAHLPRRDDEEDLAQEIFLKMFTRLDTFQGSQPFDHWVSRIAVNTCFDRLRRQRARPSVRFADLSEGEASLLEDRMHAPTEDGDPIAGENATELVERLIATLNPREQIVIRLLDLEECSVREVCERTGWGASKVKVTAMRARRKLAESLARLEKERPMSPTPPAGNPSATRPTPQ